MRRRNISSRQAKRMMKQMGLNMDSVPNVEEVVIKTDNKEITVEEPEVAIMEMKGQKIFQITGGEITEKTTKQELEIAQEDIQLVADQTGKNTEEARQALENCGGDLAKAILMLQS